MNNLKIRPAEPEDLDAILALYEHARSFMRAHGNPRQWNTTWPPKSLIKEDIRLHRNYVCQSPDGIEAVFVYLQGKDIEPTYRHIEGAWLDESEYGVVHRLAGSGRVKGLGVLCLNWAYEQCHHLRVDTHGDNVVMQNLLTKLGFRKTGIIHVEEDDDPRLAYEKSGADH